METKEILKVKAIVFETKQNKALGIVFLSVSDEKIKDQNSLVFQIHSIEKNFANKFSIDDEITITLTK